jgi:hypothetical protein
MNPCNYNWNISILELRKSRIYVTELTFGPNTKLSFFNLGGEGQQIDGLGFMRKPKERNFRYISILFRIEMSDSSKACYYFDNVDNRIEMYFHKKISFNPFNIYDYFQVC